MVKLALQIKAEMENVSSLQPNEPYEYFFQIKCTNCNETNDNVISFNRNDLHPLPNSRGEANFVWRCKFCRKESSASFSEGKPSVIPYVSETREFSTLTIIECRGMEVIAFEPRGTWSARSTLSGTVFNDIEFEDGIWTDYDEISSSGVCIMELESRIVRA